MKIGIMQPYFFPYMGYWQLMNAVDTYVIYDDVNYKKNGWINRNRILIHGKPAYFNLPLVETSSTKLINQVSINIDEKILEKRLKTIQATYAKAPYYEDLLPIIKDILYFKEDNLTGYLVHSFQSICKYLGITTDLILSSSLKKDNSLKGQEKVLHICELLKATEYYNAIGGMELYNQKDFENHSIKLFFLKSQDIVYKQYNNEFQPNLSIIDVMMFNSVERIQEMLEQYELVGVE